MVVEVRMNDFYLGGLGVLLLYAFFIVLDQRMICLTDPQQRNYLEYHCFISPSFSASQVKNRRVGWKYLLNPNPERARAYLSCCFSS